MLLLYAPSETAFSVAVAVYTMIVVPMLFALKLKVGENGVINPPSVRLK